MMHGTINIKKIYIYISLLPLVLNYQTKTLPSINVLLKYITWFTEVLYVPNKIYRE